LQNATTVEIMRFKLIVFHHREVCQCVLRDGE